MLIIVGGAGFLGSHLRMRLAAQGHGDVVVVARSALPFPAMPHEQFVSAVDFSGDVGASLIRRADAIVYLATASTVATFVDDPWQELSQNVEPFMRLLKRVGRSNPECKLVLASSGGAIYGPVTDTVSIAEDHPRRPISPYGLGKVMQEDALTFTGRTTGLGFNILRISNPVGIHGRSLSQGLVTAALRAVAVGQSVKLFGNGSHIRDILDADDVADAIVMAVADKAHRAHVWNIGSGIGISNRDVLNMVERVTGRTVTLDVLPARDVDVPRVVLDTRLSKSDLDWRPVRDVETTIAAIWQQNFAQAVLQLDK